MVEYFIFGLYVITKTMSDALQGKVALRDEILDRFYDKVYFGMLKSGLEVEGWDIITFQENVRERLSQYYAALENPAEPGPVYWLGKAVSSNVLGNTRGKAFLLFTNHVWADLCACSELVRELLRKHRVTS